MSEDSQNIYDQEKEALRFLERDYNQCFQQMRYYDSQVFDILKFMFTAYSVLAGVSLGLYQFGLKESKNLTLPAIAALIIGLLLGLFMFALAIRNRVYFVQLARYINEQRGFFFQHKPHGFENKSKMYTKHTQPPFLNWRSSQLFLTYILATLNSALFGVLIFISFTAWWKWCLVMIASIVMFAIQILIEIIYLRSRENKSSSEAIFGKKKSPA